MAKRNKALVSVIIVNFNGLHWLKDCLTAVFAQTHQQLEVILVDNNSDDESVPWVAKHFPKIKIISNDQNLGFAEANNQGYEVAAGDYIWFLNNDTQASPEVLSNSLELFATQPQVGMCQHKLMMMDDPTILDSAGSYLTVTGFLYHYGILRADQDKYQRVATVFSAKGASLFARKEALDQVVIQGELFDRRFFAYFEETDLCHRLWLAGWQVVYDPSSPVLHKSGATSSQLASSFVQFHSFKNRLATYVKNFQLQTLVWFLPLHLVFVEGIAFALLLQGNVSVFVAIHRAIWWNITHLSHLLNSRKTINLRLRQLDDRDYWPQVAVPFQPYHFWQLFNGRIQFSELELSKQKYL